MKWLLFLGLVGAVAAAVAGSHSIQRAPAPPASPPARPAALPPCADASCAVQRQTLEVLHSRGLDEVPVEVWCSSEQPALCRIRIAGTACFVEMVNWYGGRDVDEFDTVAVRPEICAAKFDPAA